MSLARAGLIGAVVAVIALGSGCSDGAPEGPREGSALADAGSRSLDETRLPPAQEIIYAMRGLRNTSDAPLEITKLRAIPGNGIPGAAQIVQVSLVPSDAELDPGSYVTFPPVTRANDRCVRADVRAPRGFTIEPDEEPLVLVWLRAVQAGRASVTGFTVNYVQDDTSFEQQVEIAPSALLRVDLETAAVKPNRDEQACASETRLLPGSVRY